MPMQPAREQGWRRGRRALLGLLAAALVSAGGAAPADTVAAGRFSAGELQQLETRMAAWIQSLREMDTRAFLGFFSRTRPSRYLSTLGGNDKADTITYARLAADMASKSGWFEVFFDAGGDDVFRDHVLEHAGRPWRRKGLTFTPPEPDLAGSVWVRWRREGATWVIDTVAEPSS
jgi:hypothetical protein